MKELYTVFLIMAISFLVAHFKPALTKSFCEIEQQIADTKLQIEIEKAKATKLRIERGIFE